MHIALDVARGLSCALPSAVIGLKQSAACWSPELCTLVLMMAASVDLHDSMHAVRTQATMLSCGLLCPVCSSCAAADWDAGGAAGAL